MKTISSFLLKVLGIVVIVFSFWKWGQSSALKNEAEEKLKEVLEDNKRNEEIDSQPFVDHPMSKMRKK